MSKVLNRIDDAKEAVGSARNLSADEKRERLAQIDRARQNLLRNADGLDSLLFQRKQQNRGKPVAPVLNHKHVANFRELATRRLAGQLDG